MRYLLDTDVLGKKDGPNGANIRKWLAGVDDNTLAISVLTVFEIRKGIQKKRDAGEDALADKLQASLEQIKEAFAGRMLPLDVQLAESWGEIAGSESKQWMDRGLIATAKANGLILVSCNAKDLKGLGVEVINPERDPPGHWTGDGAPIRAVKRKVRPDI